MTWPLVKPASGYRIFSRFVSLSVRSSIRTSTAVSLATLAHHLACGLVRAQSLEGRRSQLAGSGPLHELELCHEPRLDEMRSLGRRPHLERAGLDLERLHQALQLAEHRVAEASAYLAGVHKLAVLVIADQERAGLTATLALAFHPTPDHKLLPVAVLDLQPRPAAPAGLITRVESFGHDPFKPGLRARLEHRLPTALCVRRRLPGRAGELQLFQLPPAVRITQIHKRVPVQPHQVVDHVGHRHELHLGAHLGFGRQAHALLDLLEAWPALLVERHHLAVEDDLARPDGSPHRMHLRIPRRDG